MVLHNITKIETTQHNRNVIIIIMWLIKKLKIE